MQSNPFDGLTFDRFRELAAQEGLSRHEKVGFPDAYREGRERLIFEDMLGKLRALRRTGLRVLEIGPGCADVPRHLIAHCAQKEHLLHLADSAEMLAHLPDASHVTKWCGAFPGATYERMRADGLRFDAIIAYSVIQYVFVEGNLWAFLDDCMALLADGGEILLGDIPNVTMRKRFFSSADGISHHREYTRGGGPPEVVFNRLETAAIDDSVVLALIARARAEGFHAWVVPQAEGLPMANRREDVLIRKP
jgi:2-polyprenyl-3-methyl-5-hydroxy-6-metoxy-1,4-benzoquinol methylase